jgi:hypothetical protein
MTDSLRGALGSTDYVLVQHIVVASPQASDIHDLRGQCQYIYVGRVWYKHLVPGEPLECFQIPRIGGSNRVWCDDSLMTSWASVKFCLKAVLHFKGIKPILWMVSVSGCSEFLAWRTGVKKLA